MSAGRVLITGASGLLGRALLKVFKGKWDALGLALTRSIGELKKLDLCDFEAVTNLINEFKPHVIVHSAAQRMPDKVETELEKTILLNVLATENLAQAAANIDAFVIYISTDYVFDGSKPPYKEDDVPNPLNNYGKSKLEGEKVLLASNPKSAVLRISILYGEVEYLNESAVTGLFEVLLNTNYYCKMSDYERRYPVSTEDVAEACLKLAYKSQDQDVGGIYHLCGLDNVTKYDMVKTMSEIYNLPMNHIEPDKNPSTGAPRPYNAQMDCSKLEKVISLNRISLRDGIKKCLDPFIKM